MDALKETKTIAQLSTQYGVHPNQISHWKKQLIDEGSTVFSKVNADQQRRQESIQAELYEQIGRLKMELEWLRKKVP